MEQELADRSKGQAELTDGMALAFTDAACIMPGGRAGIRRKFKDPPAENDDEKNSALWFMPKRCFLFPCTGTGEADPLNPPESEKDIKKKQKRP